VGVNSLSYILLLMVPEQVRDWHFLCFVFPCSVLSMASSGSVNFAVFLHHENGASFILMKNIFYLPPSVDSSILTSDLLLECQIRIFPFCELSCNKVCYYSITLVSQRSNVFRGVSESFCYFLHLLAMIET